MKQILSILSCFLFLLACQSDPKEDSTTQEVAPEAPASSVSKSVFGSTPDGQADLYTLKNGKGMEVQITNYGAIVTAIKVPDKAGQLGDVVLGFDSLAGYLGTHPYFGAIVGRYGNRIANGQFKIGDKEYNLATNNGANHLHGGNKGFDKVLWQVNTMKSDAIELTYISKHLEEGYPGNLTVKVQYRLTPDNELQIDYKATTDQTTVCNITNHTYFNLAGQGDILNHQLMIKADHITPVNEGLIPTGTLMDVTGTAFDFRVAKSIGQDITKEEEQLVFGKGYDHNFVLNDTRRALTLVATAYEPTTGRYLEILTREPGVQFYTGNFLDGTIVGKNNRTYPQRSGFCLETQHFPDAPNQSTFPSTLLEPGDVYETSTVYKFSTK